jgi:NAD(P)-dependent dehydrogenase (short-subunit alcohol dehydrogenase family)
MTNGRVWFVTGSSSGFGRALCGEVAANGETVVATARNPRDWPAPAGESIYPMRLDVTSPEEIDRAVSSTIAKFGRIDVLVNNAGYGLVGAVEEINDDMLRAVVEANFFGTWNLTKAVLPAMRSAGHGHIINLSSVGGFCGFSGLAAYTATKFAVEGMSESLALEVAHLGLSVTLVEPGSFRTDFHGRSLVQAPSRIDAYDATSGETRARLVADAGNQPGDPIKAARAIIAASSANPPPLRLVLGEDALLDIENKLKSVSREIECWRQTTVNTAL